MSETEAPTPSPVAQSDRHDVEKDLGPVILPHVASGMRRVTSPHPTCHRQHKFPTSQRAMLNWVARLGTQVVPTIEKEAFFNATDTGDISEGGGGTPGIMFDHVEFAACWRNFPVQTPATNKPSTNSNRQSLARSRSRSGAPCSALCQRWS